MKVLMISTDRGLLGRGELGDVVERHRRYGENVDHLDIIVQCPAGYDRYEISPKVTAYPTNSFFKAFYVIDTMRIAKILTSKTHYDLMVAQDPFFTGLAGVIISGRHKAKLLVHFHGDFWGSNKWLRERFINLFLYIVSKYVVSKANRIRVVRGGIRRSLIEKGVAEQKISVIPTPIRLSSNKTEPEAIKHVKDEFGDAIILFVGRLTNEKNISLILKAIKIIAPSFQNTRLLIIGDGPLKHKLEMETESLKINHIVYFLGQIDHTELAVYYGAARLLVNASIHEGYPKTFIEAFSHRLPIVATATNGAMEVVEDDKNGFIVPIGDEHAFAEKISILLRDKEKALLMGERGRTFVQGLTTDTTEAIVSLWREIVSK